MGENGEERDRERRRECVTDFIAHWIRIHFTKEKGAQDLPAIQAAASIESLSLRT